MSTRALTSRMADADQHHNGWGPLVDAPTSSRWTPHLWCRIRLANSSPKTRYCCTRRGFRHHHHPQSRARLCSLPDPLPLHSPWERARKPGSRVLDVDARASPPGPKRVRDQDLPCHLTVLALLHVTEASDVAAAEWTITPLYLTSSRAAEEVERVRNPRASSSIFLPSSHFVPSSFLSFVPALGDPYF
ncbi:hypothetical protein B0H19DRAFT_1277320 [Mycena capillaripes]|nr:hypothetical protein B0H19DRAFT_1277320 [Mycena capillaripes]